MLHNSFSLLQALNPNCSPTGVPGGLWLEDLGAEKVDIWLAHYYGSYFYSSWFGDRREKQRENLMGLPYPSLTPHSMLLGFQCIDLIASFHVLKWGSDDGRSCHSLLSWETKSIWPIGRILFIYLFCFLSILGQASMQDWHNDRIKCSQG